MGVNHSKSEAVIYLVAHNHRYILCTRDEEKAKKQLYDSDGDLVNNIDIIKCYIDSKDIQKVTQIENYTKI
jgi:hypothetical protein